jgi:hypothetical protein
MRIGISRHSISVITPFRRRCESTDFIVVSLTLYASGPVNGHRLSKGSGQEVSSHVRVAGSSNIRIEYRISKSSLSSAFLKAENLVEFIVSVCLFDATALDSLNLGRRSFHEQMRQRFMIWKAYNRERRFVLGDRMSSTLEQIRENSCGWPYQSV